MQTQLSLYPGRSKSSSVFYEVHNVPVHSVLLMPTRQKALEYPKGDIELGFCPTSGLILNTAFQENRHEYSEQYEETQGFSQTFNQFHHQLAQHLIDKHQLRNKHIIEIGCGKGEFLSLLCELGNNAGIGFDPAYIPERNTSHVKNQMTFIQDFYSEKYRHYQGDFICCKMTLEHIHKPVEFIEMLRHSIGDNLDTIVFFQVPNASYVLKGLAFWDIYYEHCAYFNQASLTRIFKEAGFNILGVSSSYNNQYLTIEAKPAPSAAPLSPKDNKGIVNLTAEVSYFIKNIDHKLNKWKKQLREWREKKERVVIWGAGSKGVAFLTTLKIKDAVHFAVDINPYKKNTYLAGTGTEIVGPDDLSKIRPDIVIVMNPIYSSEIRDMLRKSGCSPRILSV